MECAHNVSTRWTASSEEFQEVVAITSMSDKQKIKYQLLALAKERVFYINTLSHHAGKYYNNGLTHISYMQLSYNFFMQGVSGKPRESVN